MLFSKQYVYKSHNLIIGTKSDFTTFLLNKLLSSGKFILTNQHVSSDQ